MAPTLWIDVEDLFEYARSNSRPSGIQRLAFQIYCVLHAQYGSSGMVRFVRHDPARNSFRCVDWMEIAALFRGLIESAPSENTAAAPSSILPHPPARQFVRKLVHRLPVSLRVPAIDALIAQNVALHAWARLIGLFIRGVVRTPVRLAHRRKRDRDIKRGSDIEIAPRVDEFDTDAAPGDVLLVLGSPWSHPDHASLIGKQRMRRGLRFALLVYDLIPLRRPEWCERGLVRLFRSWFSSVLPLCDQLFAISQATAADLEAWAREQSVELPGPVVPIPIGTGFDAASLPAVQRTRRLPPPGSYALIVSTIEARKNHLLLFRVWRRLLEQLPHERVPVLVFAGRIGWLVDDLLRQIANTDNLNGKLLIVEDPSDEELVSLYSGCLFTLFPSFYEGWGLPVTESLAFGKPCFISNRTSLPEAGGKLARCFDPDELHDAYAKIRGVIEDRADLMRWAETVKREFRPVPWSATVEALLQGLGHPLASVATADPPRRQAWGCSGSAPGSKIAAASSAASSSSASAPTRSPRACRSASS